MTRNLLFLAAVLREMDGMTRPRNSHSLDAACSLMLALQIMQTDGGVLLSLERPEVRLLKPLVERLSLTMPGPGLLLLRYDEPLHYSLLASDGIPLLEAAEKKAPNDIRQLELHSGPANRNVPAALLAHPSNIPVSAIRKFVHVRYVGRSVLSTMANRGTRVRPEVRNVAAAYLKSITNR